MVSIYVYVVGSYQTFLKSIPPPIVLSSKRPRNITSDRANPRTPTRVSNWLSFMQEMNHFLSTLEGSCEMPSFNVLSEPCTREEDVVLWCRNNVIEQMDKFTTDVGYGRFGSTNEHDGLHTKATYADRVFWRTSGNENTPTLLVEVKPPWKLKGVDIVEVYEIAERGDNVEDGNAVLGVVKQLAGYLSFAQLQYGLILTYDRCWAVKREKTEPGHLYFSPAISREGSSMFEAIAFTIFCSINDPSCPAIPPTPPSSPKSSSSGSEKKRPSSSDDDYKETPPPCKKRPPPPPPNGRQPRTRAHKATTINLDHCVLETGNVLGRGNLGMVCEGTIDGVPVTMKIVDKMKDPLGGDKLRAEYEEYEKLANLQGVALPRILGFGNLWNIFLFLIMEPSGKPLSCPINEELKRKAESCLQKLHQQRYVHGDLALRHFLMREDGTVVLVDLDKDGEQGGAGERVAVVL